MKELMESFKRFLIEQDNSDDIHKVKPGDVVLVGLDEKGRSFFKDTEVPEDVKLKVVKVYRGHEKGKITGFKTEEGLHFGGDGRLTQIKKPRTRNRFDTISVQLQAPAGWETGELLSKFVPWESIYKTGSSRYDGPAFAGNAESFLKNHLSFLKIESFKRFLNEEKEKQDLGVENQRKA